MEQIYLDNAATTPVRAQIVDKMIPYLYHSEWMNPSAAYGRAKHVAKAVERARCQVAKAIGATSDQIYFTSGGTEANNWAIKGVARGNKHKGKHIITTKVEHACVLNLFKEYYSQEVYDQYYKVINKYDFIVDVTDSGNDSKCTIVVVDINDMKTKEEIFNYIICNCYAPYRNSQCKRSC